MFLIKIVISAFLMMIFAMLVGTCTQGHGCEPINLVTILLIGGAIAFLFSKLFKSSSKKTLMIAIFLSLSLVVLVAGHFFSGLISFYVFTFFGYLGGNENEYSYAMFPSFLFWMGAISVNVYELTKPVEQKSTLLWKIYCSFCLLYVVSLVIFIYLRGNHLIPERKPTTSIYHLIDQNRIEEVS